MKKKKQQLGWDGGEIRPDCSHAASRPVGWRPGVRCDEQHGENGVAGGCLLGRRRCCCRRRFRRVVATKIAQGGVRGVGVGGPGRHCEERAAGSSKKGCSADVRVR